MKRTILIGDLHGCHDEAVALLKACDVTHEDQVIFLGDLIDRGPENAKCIDLVRRREQTQGMPACILGNHEETHIHYEDCIRRKGVLPNNGQIPKTHIHTRSQLLPEHYAWLRTLPLYLRVPEHNLVAVHAGVFPGRPIEAQQPHHLLHLQMIKPFTFDDNGHLVTNTKSIWPSRVAPMDEGWLFWTNFWDGQERIAFGHTVLTKPLITDKVIGIDGGAVFGHQLHAFILPEEKVVTVQASSNFARATRGSEGRTVQLFPIHDDVCAYS